MKKSPSNQLKENIPDNYNKRSESPIGKESYRAQKNQKPEINHQRPNNFENILNGLILLKNSIDANEGAGMSKEKNFKKYNDYFKKQKELVEKSEK